MNWRRWKRGLLIAALTGGCTALAVGLIVPGMTANEGLLVFGGSVAKDILLYLTKHPIESVADNETETKPN